MVLHTGDAAAVFVVAAAVANHSSTARASFSWWGEMDQFIRLIIIHH